MVTETGALERCDVVRITNGPLVEQEAVVMRFWMGERPYAEVKVAHEMITAIVPLADLAVVTPATEDCRRIWENVGERPTVVCLCGSTRFWREFQRASLAETLAGRIVLSIGAASGTDDEHFGNLPPEEYARIKAELDQLHLRKVEMADEVLILNVGGYIGESTARELAHAFGLGKRIRFLEPEMGKVNAALKRAAEVEITAAPPLSGDAAFG